MNRKRGWLDWLTTGAAIVALGISSITLYYSNLQPFQLHIFAAEKIGLTYHIKDQSLKVIVPCLATNRGARAGVIHSMALLIEDPQKEQSALFLKWDLFQKLDPESMVLETENMAKPVSLESSESRFHYIRFHGESAVTRWIPEPRTYHFSLLVWTGENLSPDVLESFSLTFEEADCNSLRWIVENKRGIIHWILRDGWGKWESKVLSTAELEMLTRAHVPAG